MLITKAAALVLLWTLCFCMASMSVVELISPVYKGLGQSKDKVLLKYLIVMLSVMLVLLALPFFG